MFAGKKRTAVEVIDLTEDSTVLLNEPTSNTFDHDEHDAILDQALLTLQNQSLITIYPNTKKKFRATIVMANNQNLQTAVGYLVAKVRDDQLLEIATAFANRTSTFCGDIALHNDLTPDLKRAFKTGSIAFTLLSSQHAC